ncbi:two-component sensor histidine kinase [Campylobacterota bacterium]|nr:two-component sensor histidine kinase [Campylobacterota bacterium]GHV05440.1 two-component sensor histidine kinase [Campylobacterota bacterium]
MQQSFSPETADLLQNLESLIKQVDEGVELFEEQRSLFQGVIEVQPAALWVLNSDATIYINNEKARQTAIDPFTIKPEQNDTEIEIGDRYYLLQVSKQQNRTIIVAIDNTKNRRNERLIAMGQMAAHLAHEIRNPVGSVAILSSMLYDRVKIGDKPLVLEIKKSIWRVERIVKATLLFSKGFTLNTREFLLSELIDELNASTENYSYSKSISFEFNLPSVSVSIDFELFLLVLQNLLFNAIDAIEEIDDDEGFVRISYKRENGTHTIEVEDSGKPFENPDRLFEAFYTSKTKGHGLGLILTRQIVEAHHGTIATLEDKKGFLIRFEGCE